MPFHILFWSEFSPGQYLKEIPGDPEGQFFAEHKWVQLGPFNNITMRDSAIVDGYGEEERLIARKEDGLGWTIWGIDIYYSELSIHWEEPS